MKQPPPSEAPSPERLPPTAEVDGLCIQAASHPLDPTPVQHKEPDHRYTKANSESHVRKVTDQSEASAANEHSHSALAPQLPPLGKVIAHGAESSGGEDSGHISCETLPAVASPASVAANIAAVDLAAAGPAVTRLSDPFRVISA